MIQAPLALDLGPDNIRVNAVAPGDINPRSVVAFLVSPQSLFVNGAVLPVDGAEAHGVDFPQLELSANIAALMKASAGSRFTTCLRNNTNRSVMHASIHY